MSHLDWLFFKFKVEIFYFPDNIFSWSLSYAGPAISSRASRCCSSKVKLEHWWNSIASPHMGRLGRQLNQQRGISWVAWGMPDIDWSPRTALEHSSASMMLTIGSTFTLWWASVCTFTPISVLATSCSMWLGCFEYCIIIESCCLICTAKFQLASFLGHILNSCIYIYVFLNQWSTSFAGLLL